MKLKATRLLLDPYEEGGSAGFNGAGGLNLAVTGQHLNQFSLGPGLRLAYQYKNLVPEANFIVMHDSTKMKQTLVSHFLGGSEAFSTTGVTLPKTLYKVGIGLNTMQESYYYTLTAYYELDFRRGFQAHSGYLQFAYFW